MTDPTPSLPTEYGYFDAQGPHAATREELVRMCREELIPRLVWTPESPEPMPPEEVPFLLEAIRGRLAGGAKTQAIIVGAIVAVLAFQKLQEGELYLGSPWPVYLLFGVIWAGLRVREWHTSRRLTPQGFRDLVRQAEESAVLRRVPVVYLRWVAGLIVVGGVAQGVAALGGLPEHAQLGGAMVPEAIRGGQWWRLLTCGFLHGDLIHFGVNFMALLSLGRETEVLAHRAYVPLVFLAGVLAGSLASFAVPPDVPSVGSSGGLMGLIGFLGVLGYRRREAVPAGFLNMVLLNVAVIAGIGIVGFGLVDNAAHGGGLAAGALIGALFIPTARARPVWTAGRGVQAAGKAALGILVLGAAWTAVVVALPVL
ncbi:MAG TPA: rhomboid family intramembrane serine protease [Longimicrobium sp.]|jgi:membrane associated rhomboid family serine protease